MAVRTIVKKIIPKSVYPVIEPMGHRAEAVLGQVRTGFPAKDMNIIGVTGTSGKTTTTTLVASILRAAGYKVGYMTTVEMDIGHGPQPNSSRMTTMPARLLLAKIKEAKANGLDWMVLETSSHALQQGRVWGIPYKAAVITNLTHEHLDYHGTFENYMAAKRKLFTLTDKNKGGLRLGVVNAEDEHAEVFTSAVAHPVTYGIAKGDVQAQDIKKTPDGSTFEIVAGDTAFKVASHLPGTFNVSNVLAASTLALQLGIPPEKIQEGIVNLPGVEGRMRSIKTEYGFTVIIDFAHTPDSFEKIFKEIRPLTTGRLIAVYGCAGRRDKTRRYLQGKLSGQYCDVVILTEDDDRDEDGDVIREEIAVGARELGKIDDKDLFKIPLREDAVQYAVDIAEPGDTLLLLSKGHERTIITNQGDKAWNEEEAVKTALQNRSNQKSIK